MGFTQDLFSSRRNFTDGNTRIGQTDRIWYDDHTNTLRIGDGNPGGKIIAGAPYYNTPASTYHGSFYDITNQTVSNIALAHTVSIGNTFVSNGVSISNNEIVFSVAGTYEITFSIQFVNVGNNEQDISVWFRHNNEDIPNSNSEFTIDAKSGNKPGKLIAVTPFTTEVNAMDRVQLMWNSQTLDVSVATLDARTNPTIPRTPGVIISVKKL